MSVPTVEICQLCYRGNTNTLFPRPRTIDRNTVICQLFCPVPVCDKRVCGKGDNSLIFTVVLNVPWVLPLAADSPVQKHLHNHCQVGNRVCVCFACSFCCVLREFYVAFAHPVLQKNRHFRIHITHTHTTQCLKWMDWVLLIMNIGARA